MKLAPPLAAPTAVRRLAGSFAALTVLGSILSGPAYADPDQGSSANPRDVDRIKVERAARQEMENLSAFVDAVAAARLSGGQGMSSAAQQAILGSGPVPTVGMGGLVPNARALAAYIADRYPGVQAIGGVRADALPDHPSGHAIDIMIGSDMSLGDAINADVQSQAGRFNVSYSLWRVANHYNHVHVTVY